MDANENVLEKKVSRLEILLSFDVTILLELEGKGKTVRESVEEFFKTRSFDDIVRSNAMRWYTETPNAVVLNDANSMRRLKTYESDEEVSSLLNQVSVKGAYL